MRSVKLTLSSFVRSLPTVRRCENHWPRRWFIVRLPVVRCERLIVLERVPEGVGRR